MGLGRLSLRINDAECGIEAIMLGIVTSIGGFLFGYDTGLISSCHGQISSMLLFTDFIDRFGQTQPDGTKAFDDIISSLIVSLMSIGTLIGALTGAYTADWWGRRRSLSFGVFVFIIGNIIQITAVSSWMHLMMGRFVAGFGVGNLSVEVPMFQSECCPREIRGAVLASYQLMITIGILVSNCINYGVREIQTSDASWRIVIGLGIAFSLPLGIGILFSPESPRWLAGMKDEPHNVLVEDDFKEMQESIYEQNKTGQGTWLECFTGKPSGIHRLVYRTLLGCAIHFLQQWTCVNYFFYYGATIFNSAGIDDPILVQLILGAVNVVMTFPGLYIVERVGRRVPLTVGAVWQAVWLLIFASAGSGVVMIVAACMFIASFAMSFGPFAGIGYAYGFVFFGMNLAAAFQVSSPSLKAWSSKKWVPAGYFDRNTRDEEYWKRRTSIVEAPSWPAAGAGGPGDEQSEKASERDSDDGKKAPASPPVHAESVGAHGDERRV
ncbi:hypothetical protein BDV96DRAFT_617881 [Lophiotrema nucula]|uniref:Major facilitator superfamily (MFS) profile domain-containing protein n=1 Tax=Lophiotrema nucula TaxID=690887 RepID=A0A6A5YEX4_9PLEO|nr:hypothetical protein BDV96DRAFT_617881 [Lophiotrema nucula]